MTSIDDSNNSMIFACDDTRHSHSKKVWLQETHSHHGAQDSPTGPGLLRCSHICSKCKIILMALYPKCSVGTVRGRWMGLFIRYDQIQYRQDFISRRLQQGYEMPRVCQLSCSVTDQVTCTLHIESLRHRGLRCIAVVYRTRETYLVYNSLAEESAPPFYFPHRK